MSFWMSFIAAQVIRRAPQSDNDRTPNSGVSVPAVRDRGLSRVVLDDELLVDRSVDLLARGKLYDFRFVLLIVPLEPLRSARPCRLRQVRLEDPAIWRCARRS